MLCKINYLLVLLLLLQGCQASPSFNSFQAQSCLVVYCESSENRKVKNAGLKLIEIALTTQNIDLNIGRGFCEKYYINRNVDYRYLKKSAYDVCNDPCE